MKYLIVLMASPVFARSLKASAEKFAEGARSIALAFAVFGFVYAGVAYVTGQGDAPKRLTSTAVGTFCIIAASQITDFFKGIV